MRFLWLLFSFFSPSLYAQEHRRCITHEHNLSGIKGSWSHSSSIRAYRAAQQISGIISIPVVVHVIHNDATNTPGTANNISDEQILSQIRVLNEDFRKAYGTKGYNIHPLGADTEIEFCLASRAPDGTHSSGINRVYDPKSTWNLSDETRLKNLSYWPSDQYLNIWVARLCCNYLGLAQYPPDTDINLQFPSDAKTDGVIINTVNFGDIGNVRVPYHLGRTATHEVAHWLGLFHIWGDTRCGDDLVHDTPLDEAPNFNINCIDSSNCTGKYTLDMTNNYLDWSPDPCMNMFTEGQKQRMRMIISMSPRRYSLLSSQGCQGGLVTFTSLEKPKTDFQVFPNPASDHLSIYNPLSSAVIDAQLLDLAGRNVLIIPSANAPIQVNIEELKAGIYFLLLEQEGQRSIHRIIKH